ncbi:hypothetical protein V1514DRAFT_325079, partial [Lipomyces japonicus]|uniref:uncharacterized protein n=1 Tax=Lipomyces japonicus TaxID=56871 RepID=UPI0034CE6454
MSPPDLVYSRPDVAHLVYARQRLLKNNCVVEKFVQYACEFPKTLDEIPENVTIERYFASCKNKDGKTFRIEITPEKSFDVRPAVFPPVVKAHKL